ncbi:winged helix-turn-helix domain-containing protein [Flocculibacter collagenilyticus]|uniref:winged helix-turn-helix domain-containing protein n=1 Tax=Flocculibacter collagenilyticus TaxID=2744479 RepID=UPI0018F721D3|nr:winged helix-turn-helix domain-containing protein [Flocculibacter collagenilyticus]
MHYLFDNFEFNSETLILTQQGETLDLRPYELKLLAFLISNADSVVSKEAILEHVWQGKVVADQVVFQNISHLRRIFGSEAIKTYSKRGYQWQPHVKIKVSEEQAPDTRNLNTRNLRASSSATNTNKRNMSRIMAFSATALAFLCILIIGGYVNSGSASLNTTQFSVIPLKGMQEHTTHALLQENEIRFTINQDITYQDFLNSYEYISPATAMHEGVFLTGEVRTTVHLDQPTLHLDFLIKSAQIDWRGNIAGRSLTDIFTELSDHISQPALKALFATTLKPENKLAKLQIAHQANPEDVIILSNLIELLVGQHELDKAMVFAEKLLQLSAQQSSPYYQGVALLKQSAVLALKKLYPLSGKKLKRAMSLFASIQDHKQLADSLLVSTWLAHYQKDYQAIKTSLLSAVNEANLASDPLKEINALTYLSVMAHKYKQDKDKYHYLHIAEKKIEAYRLPDHHKAVIPYHYAIFGHNTDASEPHYKQVIALTQQVKHHKLAQSSQRSLLTYYLNKGREDDAVALLNTLEDDDASALYLRMQYAKYKNNHAEITAHAIRAFELAEGKGERILSLDVALALCDLSPSSHAFYCQFIQEQAPQHWLDRRKINLDSLSV